MITSYDFEDDTVTTNGCGCCSEELNLRNDREEIVSHLARELAVMDKVLEFYGMGVNDLRRSRDYAEQSRWLER